MKNYRNLLKKVYTEISEEIPESTRPYKLDEVQDGSLRTNEKI